MAETVGRVQWIKTSDSLGLVAVRPQGTTNLEAFIIWFSGEPQEPSAFTRVVDSMQVALLRDAMLHDLSVVIIHNDNSAYILSLRVNAPGT